MDIIGIVWVAVDVGTCSKYGAALWEMLGRDHNTLPLHNTNTHTQPSLSLDSRAEPEIVSCSFRALQYRWVSPTARARGLGRGVRRRRTTKSWMRVGF